MRGILIGIKIVVFAIAFGGMMLGLSGCVKPGEFVCWAKGQQMYPARDQNGNFLGYYYCA